MADEQKVLIDGTEIWIEHVEARNGGGARIDVMVKDDDRTWRVDVSKKGSLQGIVTTWKDGAVADLEEPDWLEEAVSRLARAAV